MPWNPDIYLQFKNIRFNPFFDLAALIEPAGLQTAVDIGCGTGEQTAILAQQFSGIQFTGFDASAEMLAKSKEFESNNLQFQQATIEEFADNSSTYDLVFSNAALQWSDEHYSLFPKLIAQVNPGGQFAVQMPCQKENVLNQLLFQLVNEKPFVNMLQDFTRPSPVLTIDEYAKLLFDNGLSNINLFIKVYPIIASNETELYNFIAGSALIPYMERLDEEQQEMLKVEFLQRIKNYFVSFPAMYAFKRILMHGTRQ